MSPWQNLDSQSSGAEQKCLYVVLFKLLHFFFLAVWCWTHRWNWVIGWILRESWWKKDWKCLRLIDRNKVLTSGKNLSSWIQAEAFLFSNCLLLDSSLKKQNWLLIAFGTTKNAYTIEIAYRYDDSKQGVDIEKKMPAALSDLVSLAQTLVLSVHTHV